MSTEPIGEVTVDGISRPIEVDRATGRFNIGVGDDVAFLQFHIRGSVLSLIHTEVPEALRGRGLADALARAALTYARRNGMRVRVICPFVAKFLARHSEFQDVVDATDGPGRGTS